MTGFKLNPRLAADTVRLGDLALSTVLLMDDSRFPWLILVPRRPDLREIIDLAPAERGLLMEEVAVASQVLRDVTGAEKLNLGSIGNLVPQLHIHVVARFATDEAWPAPVWGRGTPNRYDGDERGGVARRLGDSFGFMSDQGGLKRKPA